MYRLIIDISMYQKVQKFFFTFSSKLCLICFEPYQTNKVHFIQNKAWNNKCTLSCRKHVISHLPATGEFKLVLEIIEAVIEFDIKEIHENHEENCAALIVTRELFKRVPAGNSRIEELRQEWIISIWIWLNWISVCMECVCVVYTSGY